MELSAVSLAQLAWTNGSCLFRCVSQHRESFLKCAVYNDLRGKSYAVNYETFCDLKV